MSLWLAQSNKDEPWTTFRVTGTNEQSHRFVGNTAIVRNGDSCSMKAGQGSVQHK